MSPLYLRHPQVFGSAATVQMTKDSDIDLLIVDGMAVLRCESVAITDAIGDVCFPVDVKIISSERFEAPKHIIAGIAYPAHKYGRTLYYSALGRNPAAGGRVAQSSILDALAAT